MIYVNRRGLAKKALEYWDEKGKDILAEWTSKYGSVTFSQFGMDVAFSGINEAGLSVHELWLDGSVYPSPDSRPSVSVDQYVQYLLDNFRNVDEAVAGAPAIRPRPVKDDFTKIHFFVSDASGQCAVLDFLGGRLAIHAGAGAPVKAMANDPYEDSLADFRRSPEPGPNDQSSFSRFNRIAARIAKFDAGKGVDAVDYAFGTLDCVRQGGYTKFQVVLDVKRRMAHFTSLRDPVRRSFSLDAFDYSASTKSRVLDMNAESSGDVTARFSVYTTAKNEAVIAKGWEHLGYFDVYKPALRLVSRYPETFRRSEPR
jgi:choloylglycine hydrolase